MVKKLEPLFAQILVTELLREKSKLFFHIYFSSMLFNLEFF